MDGIYKKVKNVFCSLMAFAGFWFPLHAFAIPYQTDSVYSAQAELAEPFTPDQLIYLFLTTSGTDERNMPLYTEKLRRIIADLELFLESQPGDLSEQKTGEQILLFMHDQILNGYSLTQTRLDVLLQSGQFNCVSSAALYMVLTRAAGLSVYGIHTTDHAFCVVASPDGLEDIDVETTNIWGFNPGTKKEFHSEFTDQTGFAYVPPGEYSYRERLGDKDMAGLILQNRIVEHQNRNQYDDALALAANRLALTATERAQKDYFDSVQNLAAWHNNRKEYEQGVDIIQEAAKGPYGLPDFLIQTRSQLVYNLCGSILNRGDTAQAERMLTRYKDLLSKNLLEELVFLMEEKKLDSVMKQGYSEDTVGQIQSSLNSGIITAKRAEEMLIFLYAKEAERLAFAGDYLEGLLFLQDVSSWVRETRDFSRLLSVYQQNYAVAVHNSIIPLINAGRRDEAKGLIEEALLQIPGNSLLLEDLSKLERMR